VDFFLIPFKPQKGTPTILCGFRTKFGAFIKKSKLLSCCPDTLVRHTACSKEKSATTVKHVTGMMAVGPGVLHTALVL